MPQKPGERAEEARERSRAGDGLYSSPDGSGQVFRKTFVQVTTTLVLVGLALFAYATSYFLLLVFAGVLLAVLLDSFANQLMRAGFLPHWVAVTIVLLVLAALLVLLVVLVVPMVVNETMTLATQMRKSADQLVQWLQENAGGQFVIEQVSALEDGGPSIKQMWLGVAGIFATTMGAVTGMVIIMIVGIFIAYKPRMYTTGFICLMPVMHRERAAEVLEAVGVTLRWWLLGQMISMAITGITTWIALALLGVPQALILALIAGLLAFIPYLGPLMALVPILLVAFLESPLLALYALVLYLIFQNVESNVIMPIVFQRTAHIPPAVGVVSQVLFGSLLGVLGFALAIPLTAVILQFVKMVYIHDILGDTSIGKHAS